MVCSSNEHHIQCMRWKQKTKKNYDLHLESNYLETKLWEMCHSSSSNKTRGKINEWGKINNKNDKNDWIWKKKQKEAMLLVMCWHIQFGSDDI